MSLDQFDELIRRYRQELLQFQSRSTAAPPTGGKNAPDAPPASKSTPVSSTGVPIHANIPPAPLASAPPAPTPEPSAPAPAPVPPPVTPPPEPPVSEPVSPVPSEPKPFVPAEPPNNPSANVPPLPLLGELIRCDDSYTDAGRLRVAVTTARQAVPVADADVTIFCTQNGTRQLKYFLRTDQSGLTPTVPLPAPPAVNSETPGDRSPYALYGLRVHKPGFAPVTRADVQVFAGVSGTVAVDLIPSSGGISSSSERG